jgi:hypothetical protein
MESGLTMVVHAVVIGLALYFVMCCVLNQPARVSEDRSVAIAAAVLLYMVVFGHRLPGRVNPNLF